jgi:hypothetical protein
VIELFMAAMAGRLYSGFVKKNNPSTVMVRPTACLYGQNAF